MSTSSPYQTDPYQRSPALARSFLPLALITLGVAFLLGNLVPERGRGGLIVLGLGLAFLVGRLTTGRYGYAVPAGILIAIGAFISLQQVQAVPITRGPGLFFVLLGLGFALVYVVGGRPQAIWPLFPATILVGLGLIFFGVTALAPLAGLAWIVGYWPVALVVVGVWLLVRDQLPVAARRPIATLGGLGLLAYGILAAAASVAAGGALVRGGFAPTFGRAPFADTISLEAPIAAGQSFNVSNQNGRTVIRAGNGTTMRVSATRHYSLGGAAPDVRLNPSSDGVSLETAASNGRFPFGGSNSVDYAIDIPPAANVKVESGSGQVEIDGVMGSVQAESGSGELTLSNLGGNVQARTGSGAIELNNLGGELRATAGSGAIRGTGLRHVRDVSTSSGAISLEGVFVDQAQVRASSGGVTVKLLPGSAVQLDVRSGSGSVVPSGLALSGGVTQRDRLAGAIGTPAAGATLSIETSSGSVFISQ